MSNNEKAAREVLNKNRTGSYEDWLENIIAALDDAYKAGYDEATKERLQKTINQIIKPTNHEKSLRHK